MTRTTGELSGQELTETRYSCEQCGAMQVYAVGSGELECRYCGHRSAIVSGHEPIREKDFYAALRELEQATALKVEKTYVKCVQCAAQFELDENIHAGECPFCGTSVITSTSHLKPIKAGALLPFSITKKQAQARYKTWLASLWFAPGALKDHAREATKLHGIYIPYWTYDSQTHSSYSGMRGDIYYVQQSYTSVENGRHVTRTRREPRIRWTPASGHTQRHFDDVLIGASRTLPRKITDWLEPWDLENMVPYSEAYISGFSSEVYQVDLDEGFSLAQGVMENFIRRDVKHQIGGDQQRITHLQTQHSETSFKHVLLPLWSASFNFKGKTYRFVVNGRNGNIQGERPYSWVKIAFTLTSAGSLLAGAIIWLDSRGFL